MSLQPDSKNSLLKAHSRAFDDNRYVYPVLSRRAGGISIGVNLNLDQWCNFRCVYCQIQRLGRIERAPMDLARLEAELDAMLDRVVSGSIFRETQFQATASQFRRLNDIAFSGDGEPTACPVFAEAVTVCAEVRRRKQLPQLKLVLITNASLLHQPRVAGGLEILDANNGEIWAKLDAGTEDFFRQVACSDASFQQVLDNIHQAALVRPLVIQTLLMRIRDERPPPEELEAYCGRLCDIVAAGGQIKLVQIHTIARKPAVDWVAPLSDSEIDRIGDLVRRRTRQPVAVFYG
jgi:wyosine [tRNA(Phe)-imidazoG37] synthetase (radical SAM superfamily)